MTPTRLRFPELVQQFVQSLERAGVTVLVTHQGTPKPAEIRIVSADATTDCLLFLWNITPGGGGPGVRPDHERRIQITASPAFPLRAGVRTVVGGFSEENGVWSFWDARRHTAFSTRSPSLQTSLPILEAANLHGLAAGVRPASEGREVTVAVRPEFLPWYVESGEALHDADTDATHVADLIDAKPEDEAAFVEQATTADEQARRVQLIETVRAFRDARFRPEVLRAYSYRCAVCGTALKLVDAAHIVPVNHPQGSNEITNGLALCRLHQAAYDTGLMGVRSDYKVIMNHDAAGRLRHVRLDGGLDAFSRALPAVITTPATIELRPDPDRLRLGLEIRQFPPLIIA